MAYTALWQDTLPWSDTERDRKLISYLFIAFAATTVIFLILKFLPPMEQDEKKLEEIAPRLAKLIIEKKARPKPVPKPKAKKKEKPKPKEKPKAKPKPKAKDKPKPKPKAKPKPKPKIDRAAQARKKAEKSFSAVEDALADMRDFDVASLDKNKPVTSGSSKSTAKDTTTAIIASSAARSSGGINTSQLSRATGSGGSLQGRSTTNVKSSIGSGGAKRGSRTGGAGGQSSRPYEEIELVFQKNKGRIFSLYNRALRKDPSLQGKIVLELTIQPNGRVSKVRIISSELNNPTLESKLIRTVKGFRFKARTNVGTLVVKYPIDFLPT
ncbi:hypothetical protein MNBD_GAMMA21-2969 [hydrothermal vent metagenome]|uniref:TonB C-terminal domain-containing protein n=1 Tax=hydrothermal vent metagenome TaxID=652676 RepID=A0A3B1A4P6_9ZZZZ